MDINLLFKDGMRKCGRVLKVLPKDEIGSPMEYMMRILKEETLPSLNIIYPRLYKTTISLSELIPTASPMDSGIDNRYVAYRIPPSLTEGLGIMSIKSCVPTTQCSDNNYGGYGSNIGAVNQNFMLTGVNRWGRFSSANMYEATSLAVLNYADSQLLGPITQSFRYYFYPPNILLLNQSYSETGGSLTFTFCLENDENLISIENTAYEGVRELFILDLKASIYSEYGLFSDIETPSGPLNLKIEDWSGAESDRRELFQQYLSTAHIRNTAMRSG